MSQPHDFCACGEWRCLHDEKGCRLCGAMSGPENGCNLFRFFRHANAEEIAHYEKYKPGQKVVIKSAAKPGHFDKARS